MIIDGETGLLVEPNDANQIADVIERIGCDHELSRRLAENGRKHIVQYFQLENALQPLIELYSRQLYSDRTEV